MKRLVTIAIALLFAASAHAAYVVKAGSTSVLTPPFKFVDTTTGVAKTDITGTDIDLSYHRANTAASVKVDAVMHGAITDAWDADEVFEVDDTLHPGCWRIDWPDAAFADGVNYVILTATVTGAYPVSMLVRLVDYDPQDTVRLGLTALPNVAAGAAGGLPDDTDANGRVRIVDGAGAGEINTDAGKIVEVTTTVNLTTNNDKTGYSIADATSDAVIAHAVWGADATTYQTQGTFGQAIGDPVADADTIWGLCNTNLDAVLSARTLAAADYFLFGTDAVANVTLVATTTTNTDMRGTDNAALAATRPGRRAERGAQRWPTRSPSSPTSRR